jgi:transposase-like protein
MARKSVYTCDECGQTAEVEFGEPRGWITIMYKGVTLHVCGRSCMENLYPKLDDKVEAHAKKRAGHVER